MAAGAAQAPKTVDSNCELAITRRQTILDALVTPKADFVVVLRAGGCLETWNLAEKRQVAKRSMGVAAYPGAHPAARIEMMPGSIVVVDERSAFDAITLTPVPMPRPNEGDVLHNNEPSVGIRNLKPALSRALALWAPKFKATLRTEEGVTWIDPNPDDSSAIEHQVGISEDGKLFFADTKLIRLDTGRVRDFAVVTPRPLKKATPAPVKPIPPDPIPRAPIPPGLLPPGINPGEPNPVEDDIPEEPPEWTIHIELGPRSDRAIVSLVARKGDGTEKHSFMLVDTNTMRTLVSVGNSCEWPNATWSPKGKWILYQRCHESAPVPGEEARAVDTGKLVRRVPSRNFHFAADDEIGVALGVVKNLASNTVLFEVPKPGPSWIE